MIRLATVVGLALSALPAAAQNVLGTSLVDGQKVELLADHTWRFVGDRKDGCILLTHGLSFCGAPTVWRSSTPAKNDIIANYRHDDRHYGQFVVEGLGTEDGLTLDVVRKAVIQVAANATQVPAESINVIEVTPAQVDGHSGETVVYAFK